MEVKDSEMDEEQNVKYQKICMDDPLIKALSNILFIEYEEGPIPSFKPSEEKPKLWKGERIDFECSPN